MSVQGSSAHPSEGSPSDRVGSHSLENPQPHRPSSSVYGKSLDATSLAMAVTEAMAAPSFASLTAPPTRAIETVDIAAFAAQAAHAAHADHAAAMLRRKQATVATASSTTTRSNSQEAKEPIRHAPSCEEPRAANGAPPSSSSSAGAGMAFCLIPQPYHQNGHIKRQSTESGGNSETTRSDAGGVAAIRVGGEPSPTSLSTPQSAPGSGGGGADGGFGGGAQARSNADGPLKRKARALEENGDNVAGGTSASMSAESRLERSREQNRQSSRKARLRRKSEEMSLKEQIQGIQVFRLIVEEGPDMMSIHGMDHRAPFRYASSAFQRVAGINPRDVLGRGLTDLIVLEDHAIVQQALLKVVFSHTSDNIVSYRMLTPEGKTLVVQTSIRTGDQCIICVARVMNLHQPFPVNIRPAGAPLEDPYSSRRALLGVGSSPSPFGFNNGTSGPTASGKDAAGGAAGGGVIRACDNGGGHNVRPGVSRCRSGARVGPDGGSSIESEGDEECV